MSKPGVLVVVAEFTVEPADRQKVTEVLLEIRRQTLATEDGCRTYEVCVNDDDPHLIMMVEIYDDEAAFLNHKKSEHFDLWPKNGEQYVKDVKVKFLNRLLM